MKLISRLRYMVHSYIPLVEGDTRRMGAGGGVRSEGGAGAEADAEGVARMSGVEIPEDLLRALGLPPAVFRGVQLLGWVSKSLVEYGQHVEDKSLEDWISI
ncbi:uncharacterized protein A4U43_C10F12250 [Asparagus officinalis]|uniref:Uncharacterized protein n=1 Tax=Asparagus officinalis TaxID=4686 RepID=A0A5P1E2Q8_ASPOF|nr:uncharacterized protein A4U43_C10F12250 [Asparagus officinalis]